MKMKYARLLLVFLTMLVCLVLFSGQASAFDLRDVQPPAGADKVVFATAVQAGSLWPTALATAKM